MFVTTKSPDEMTRTIDFEINLTFSARSKYKFEFKIEKEKYAIEKNDTVAPGAIILFWNN